MATGNAAAEGSTEAKSEEGAQLLDTSASDPLAEDGKANDAEKKQNGQQQPMLLSVEQIEHYRTDSSWRVLRYALLGTLVFTFLALLVAAVLIVALSGECSAPKAGELSANVKPTTEEAVVLMLAETPRTSEGKWMRETNEPPNIKAVFLPPLVSPLLLNVPEGAPVTFQCEHSSAKVRWNRVGPSDALQPPDGTEQLSNGTLWIRAAKLSHQGEYVCEGQGPNRQWQPSERAKLVVHSAEEQKTEQTAVASVSPAPTTSSSAPALPVRVPIRPRVDSYLKLAFADEPVHFRCWMAGKSSDELVWRKLISSDQQQRDTRLMVSEPDGQSAFLIFGAVKETDAGEYECVETGTDTRSSVVRLRVEPSRSPVVEPLEQTVPAMSSAQLHCSVPGHPNALLVWRRENGVEVSSVDGVADDARGTLRIASVRPEHTRMGWVCWAIYGKEAKSSGTPAVVHTEETEEEGSGEAEEDETTDAEKSGREAEEDKEQEQTRK